MNHVRCFRGWLCICVQVQGSCSHVLSFVGRTSCYHWTKTDVSAVVWNLWQWNVNLWVREKPPLWFVFVSFTRSFNEYVRKKKTKYYDVGTENFGRIDSLTCFRVLFQHSRRRDSNLGFVMIRPVVLKRRSSAESWQLTTSSVVVLPWGTFCCLYLRQRKMALL